MEQNNITNDLLLLITFDNPLDAEIVKSTLEASGIDVFLYSTKDSFIPTIGEYQLYVKKSDYDDAKNIITQSSNTQTDGDYFDEIE